MFSRSPPTGLATKASLADLDFVISIIISRDNGVSVSLSETIYKLKKTFFSSLPVIQIPVSIFLATQYNPSKKSICCTNIPHFPLLQLYDVHQLFTLPLHPPVPLCYAWALPDHFSLFRSPEKGLFFRHSTTI